MRTAIYGFLAGLVAILAVVAAYLNRKAERALDALSSKQNELNNEVKHNEQMKGAQRVKDELDDFDDTYLAERLRDKR